MSRQSNKRRRDKRKKRIAAKQPLPQQPQRTPPTNPTAEQLMERTGNWSDKMLIDVGQAMHKGRTVEPILPEQAPESATYDDLVGITYAPLDIETDGFKIVANPRRIGVTEVATYAKSSCKSCQGRGRWKVTRTQKIGVDEIGQKIMQPTEYEQLCPCAETGYKKKHKTFLADTQLGEWIALDGLQITKTFAVEVKGVGDAVPQVPPEEPDDKSPRAEGVPELSQAG